MVSAGVGGSDVAIANVVDVFVGTVVGDGVVASDGRLVTVDALTGAEGVAESAGSSSGTACGAQPVTQKRVIIRSLNARFRPVMCILTPPQIPVPVAEPRRTGVQCLITILILQLALYEKRLYLILTCLIVLFNER